MTGATPFRKRPFRRKKASEAQPGGTGPTDVDKTSAESTALVQSSHRETPRDGETSQREDGELSDAAGAHDGEQGLPVPLDDTKGPVTGARRLAALRQGIPAIKQSVPAMKQGARKGGEGAKAALGHLTDRIVESAPRVPVRDLATLRKHFPGLGPEEIADKLVAGASNGTSTVGAGIGAAAMLPVPMAMPAELATEITGVAAIELKLIAELHEVYGQRPPGNLKQRTFAYLGSWAEERGIDVTKPTTLNAALGGQMKRELRQQIMKRMVRNLPNLMPFMVGAAVGAVMNRRDTRKLADRIRGDLRKKQVPWDALKLPPLDHARELKELEG
ncbi:hypothetical protein ACIQM4_00530 [Streptomyces sp. NPDC091272]|uniref:hypothetical protein n=1 Tax=Streptomyces sp. NPDC091272 TaxID=3365981 RepID=UPI0037F77F17